MSDGGYVRIKKLTNGYEVSLNDPAIIKYNRTRDNDKAGSYKPWKDPERAYVFTDLAGLITFLKTNLPKAMTSDADEFDTAFEVEAVKEDD